MDAKTYERPREKIIATSVTTLNDSELLQAILGSGIQGSSVHIIARRIVKLLRTNKTFPSYETLCAIDGVGPAKASTIVAAYELARRHTQTSLRSHTNQQIQLGTIYCEFLSTAGHCVDERWYPVQLAAQLWVKNVLSTSLNNHATAICIRDGEAHTGSLAKLEVLERRQRLAIACDAIGIRIVKYEWTGDSELSHIV